MRRAKTLDFPLSQLGDQFSTAGSLRVQSTKILLADHEIRQFWLPKPGLYGTRQRQTSNHAVVLDYYRLLCFQRVTDRLANPAKTHLLASLLPRVRTNKAQNIFPDASVKPPRGCPKTPGYEPEDLELLLEGSQTQRLTLVEFQNQNRTAVEYPCYPESTFELYRDYEHRLFDGASDLWWHNPVAAQKLLTDRWDKWHHGIGRRRGNVEQKDVLNILSYESKAAFHQCYSALWVELIPYFVANQPNQVISRRFHSLWHLDQRLNVPGSARVVHLLHGLAVGLHPAFGMLLTTNTGRRIVGEMVANPDDLAAQERFFQAGMISLYLYATTRRFRCPVVS